MLKEASDFLFEITEAGITRVDCICFFVVCLALPFCISVENTNKNTSTIGYLIFILTWFLSCWKMKTVFAWAPVTLSRHFRRLVARCGDIKIVRNRSGQLQVCRWIFGHKLSIRVSTIFQLQLFGISAIEVRDYYEEVRISTRAVRRSI